MDNEKNVLLFSPKFVKQREYWLNTLAGEPGKTDLPTMSGFKTSGVDEKPVQPETIGIALPETLAKRLVALGKQSDLSIYIMLVTMLQVLFYRYGSGPDIITVSPLRIDKVSGETVNNRIFIRTAIDDNNTVKQVILAVRQAVLDGYSNQDYPSDSIVRYLYDRTDSTLSTIGCALEPLHDRRNTDSLPVKILFSFTRSGDEISGRLLYDASLYDGELTARMARHFISLCQQALDDVNQPITSLDILSDDEKQRLTLRFNGTSSDYPKDATVYRLILDRAQKNPLAPALHGETDSSYPVTLTLSELIRRSENLSYRLRDKGLTSGSIAAILMERSIDMVIAILAILKAGAAYLPIDTEHPRERIDYMIADSGASMLVTGDMTASLETEDRLYSAEFSASGAYSSSDPAYVIYTSGSTGRPKGVMVEHASLINLCFWHNANFNISFRDHATQYAGAGFDASVWEIFPYLIQGAMLHVIADSIRLDIAGLNRYFNRHDITVAFLPTQVSEQFMREDNRSLRLLLVGGDKLNSLPQPPPAYDIHNNYGPTENTVVATSCPVTRNGKTAVSLDNIPIGPPIYNNRIYILDPRRLELMPQGLPGELCISGSSLARGYVNNPGLTAQRFIQVSDIEANVYRTGDLARWLDNGSLQFLGRVDEQVKIRGFRIEPGEIRNRLLLHPAVNEAILIARDAEGGDKYLCAYVTASDSDPEEEINSAVLSDYLAQFFPAYMIPSYFIVLESMPLTPNGKIDKRALPQPEISGGKNYIAPRNEIEKRLAGIWADILHIDAAEIGASSNFFHLGGHSLKATKLSARIHQDLGVKIELADIFKTPTIEGMATHVTGKEKERYRSIQPVEKKQYYPCSSAQKRLYVLHQLDPDNTGYNMPYILPLEGGSEFQRIEETFKRLIQRHESLRTSFHLVDNEPVQRIHDNAEFSLGKTGPDPGCQPFDLSRAPLIRAAIFQLETDQPALFLDMHHIISDGLSQEILKREFLALYRGSSLPMPRLQYKDYSQWLNSPAQRAAIKRQEQYWLKHFANGVPVLELPYDFKRPALQQFDGAAKVFSLDEEVTLALEQRASQQGASLYMMLMTAFVLVLSRLGSCEEIVIGTPVAARRHADLEPVTGMFVNTLAIRYEPNLDLSLEEFLLHLKTISLEAFDNQEYPYEDLVEHLDINRDVSRNPLFDVMFSLVDDVMTIERRGQDSEPAEDHLPVLSKFDLSLSALRQTNGMSLELEYCTKLFTSAAVNRIGDYIIRMLNILAAAGNYGLTLSDLSLLDEAEKDLLLFRLNNVGENNEYDFPGPVYRILEERAAKDSDTIALVEGDLHLSTGEFNRRADTLAHHLRDQGIEENKLVAVLMDRSALMVLAIFAVLKSGGAYLPIEPDTPVKRRNYMLHDSGASLLLTTTALFSTLAADSFDIAMMNLEDERLFRKECVATGVATVSANGLAYVIYTSGSTGAPKGVLVEHRCLSNFIDVMQDYYPVREGDAYLLKTNYIFDISITELLGWIFNSGRLVILEPGAEKEPFAILDAVSRHRISHINFVPSMMGPFLDVIQGKADAVPALKGLRYLMMGGEAFPGVLLEKIRNLALPAKVENLYGPTEATIYASKFSCPDSGPMDAVPIGKPFVNLRLYVLDRRARLLPFGAAGELCIAGIGIARGYLNRPELTMERFPLIRSQSPIPHTRLYRTGDRARWLADGNLQYLGRIDQQVKIRGFRIELGEIENKLVSHPAIREAAVLTGAQENGVHHLVAYLAAANNEDQEASIDISQLREYLANELPPYMIPSQFMAIDGLPLTPSGKLDRRRLRQSAGVRLGSGTVYHAPRNPLEQELASVWAKVLGLSRIGINDDFFLSGGDSIKAIQVVSRMNKAGYRLEMKDIFLYHTISRLSPYVKKIERIPDQSAVQGEVPLTPIQESFFRTITIDRHHYNQAVLLKPEQPLDEKMIRAIFTKLQDHHDALRMVFKPEPGAEAGVRQVNLGPGIPVALEVFDLRNATEAIAELQSLADRIQASISLEEGPLMKLGLFHLPSGDRLLVAVHHLVIDGVSWRILFEDLDTLYRQYKAGTALELPLKTDSYLNWSCGLRDFVRSSGYTAQAAYWRKMNEQIQQVPAIPLDFPGGSNLNADKESRAFVLNEDYTKRLLTSAHHALGANVDDLLIAALSQSVQMQFGHSQTLVHMEGHGRESVLDNIDVSRTIGWFTAVYPVIAAMPPQSSLIAGVKGIKEALRQVPFKGVGYRSNQTPRRGLRFNYLGQLDEDIQKMPDFDIAGEAPGRMQGPAMQREYELDVTAIVSRKRLTLSMEFSRQQVEGHTVENWLNHYRNSLEEIIDACSALKERQLTPSDLTHKGVSMETLEKLEQRLDIQDIYPLSPMQEGMLFHSLYDRSDLPGGSHTAYFQQISYRLNGDMNETLVEKALDVLFQRHENLKAAFIHKGLDEPLQVIIKNRSIGFHYDALEQMSTLDEKERYIKAWKENRRHIPFDLEKDTSMQAALFKLDDGIFDFTWSHHHILMDGWCIGILTTEFLAIHNALSQGREASLPPVSPYRHYLQWLQKQDLSASLEYWQHYLRGLDQPVQIPGQRTEIISAGIRKEKSVFTLEPQTLRAAEALTGQLHVTLSTLFRVIWGVLLAKVNQSNDVVFGAVVSGRPSAIENVEQMVGLFINTLPVRVRFGAGTTIKDLLQEQMEHSLNAEDHQYVPLVEIQAQSTLKRQLVDHILVFENYPIGESPSETSPVQQSGQSTGVNLRLTGADAFEQTNYAFNILVTPGESMRITFDFDANVYEKEIIDEFAILFRHLLDQILDAGSALSGRPSAIAELDIMPQHQRQRIVSQFNDTAVDFPPFLSLLKDLDKWTAQQPEHPAILGEQPFTYRDFNRQVDGLAAELMDMGVSRNTIVAVIAPPSSELIIAITAVLRAGGAYMPIDPSFPISRINFMLKDSDAKLLLTTSSQEEQLSREFQEQDLAIFSITLSEKGRTKQRKKTIDREANDLAYIIYTSGSTGQPKGVMVNRGAIQNTLNCLARLYPMTPDDVYLFRTSFMFDVSISEILGWFRGGASLAIPGPDAQKDPVVLLETIHDHRVSHVNFVPSLFNALVGHLSPSNVHMMESLKYIFLAGEALPPVLVRQFRQKTRGLEISLENIYGPTEAAIYTNKYSLEKWDGHTIPIGAPMDNVRVYVLDNNLQLLPIGVTGELYLSGPGLARGYLNNPGLTASRFLNFQIPNTNSNTPSIIYKTGDRARWLPGGDIEYLGRKDQQVKVRGFRIEPGEIENHLRKHPLVHEAVVLLKQDNNSENYLCAYVQAVSQPLPPGGASSRSVRLDKESLRSDLAALVPAYMIPGRFVFLETIPRTATGKLDRNALPDPVSQRGESYISPTSPLERELIEIWSGLLGIPEEVIGVGDDFFKLGGHSLKAMMLISRIDQRFGVYMPLASMFASATVRKIALFIEEAEVRTHSEIQAVEEREYYPLSSAQSRLFFLHQNENIGTTFHLLSLLRMDQKPDITNIEKAFYRIMSHQESLRTCFEIIEGEPVQRIRSIHQIEFHVQIIESGGRSEEDIIKTFIRPFDLAQSPLLRMALTRSPEGQFLLLFDMHHIISDGVSMAILMDEFNRFFSGRSSQPPAVQYKDFTMWQKQMATTSELKKMEEYWLKRFEDARSIRHLDGLCDYPYDPTISYSSERLSFEMGPADTMRLKALMSVTQTTLYMNVIALLNIILHKLTGKIDITIGSSLGGRTHAGLQRVIGFFINMMPIRNFPSPGKSFSVFLQEVKESSLEAFENQNFQFETLIKKLNIRKGMFRNPLFNVNATVLSMEQSQRENTGGNRSPGGQTDPYTLGNPSLDVDLNVMVVDMGKKIYFNLDYARERFKTSTIHALADQLSRIAGIVLEDKYVKIGDIELSEESRREKQKISARIQRDQAIFDKLDMEDFD